MAEPVETKPVTSASLDAARAKPPVEAAATPKGSGGLLRWVIALAAVLAVVAVGLMLRGGGGRDTPAVVETPIAAPVPGPVDAPPAVLSMVRIDASPWAEVVEVIGEDGVLQPLPSRRHTPLRMPLAVGRYQLTLLHPDATAPVSCAVDVREGEDATCEARFEAPSVTALFKATGWWR